MDTTESNVSEGIEASQIAIEWKQRLKYLYPPTLVMVFSLLFTTIVILSNPGFYPLFPPNPYTIFESLVIVAVIGVVGGVATVMTFMVFKRGSERLHRVVIAAFLSPVFFVLTIFLGEAILLILVYPGLTNFHLAMLTMGSIMFAAFAIVFIFTDTFGSSGRNIIFTLYGIILGVWIGINFTWYVSLVLLIILAIEDTLFASKLGPTIIEADPETHARSAFTFVVGPLIIGIGDLVVFSALVAYSLRYFGWLIAIFSLIAILIGSLINTQIVTRYPNRVIPGLPIPLLCALVPILIGLWQLFLLNSIFLLP